MAVRTIAASGEEITYNTHTLTHTFIYIYWLAVSTPLKNILASWDYEIPNIWKNRGFSNHQPNILPSGIAIENDHL
jgi:hypothetical protein